MAATDSDLWTQTEDGRHIVSKCGLYCDTCPAFIHGLCQGCPKLSLDDCVVKACAHRKEIATCHDCEKESCYHFEAYYERRQMMRRRVKRLLGKQSAYAYRQGEVPAKSGCGSGGGCGGCGTTGGGGCGSSGGGCGTSGASGGCGAVGRIAQRLEEIAAG